MTRRLLVPMHRSSESSRFGPFEIRTRTREVYKHGIKLKLRPQPFQILYELLSRPGELVTRDELREKLWSSETFVDFEQSLNTSIKELRAVLGDSATEPQYIETVPRLGYRFIGPAEVIESPPPKEDSALFVPAVDPGIGRSSPWEKRNSAPAFAGPAGRCRSSCRCQVTSGSGHRFSGTTRSPTRPFPLLSFFLWRTCPVTRPRMPSPTD